MRSNFCHPERTVPLLCLLLLPLLAAPASGGVAGGNGEIGFDFGWAHLDGRDHGDGGRFTFRGGYHFNDFFQLEAQILGIGADSRQDVEALGGVFTNAVFNWHPGETIVPYVLVGLGVMESEPLTYYQCHGGPGGHGGSSHRDHHGSYHDDDYEASGAVQVGVGSRFFFGQGRTAVRVEASLLAFEDDFYRQRELVSLSVGLTWRLGKNRPRAGTTAGSTD